MRDINSKSRRTNNSLVWDSYETYEEYGKEAGLKWYFCTLIYANKYDNMKKGMIGIILYNKRNTFSFRSHFVTAHKSTFSHFVSYIYGQPNIVAGYDASSLEGIVYTPLSRRKMSNYESSFTSSMAFF